MLFGHNSLSCVSRGTSASLLGFAVSSKYFCGVLGYSIGCSIDTPTQSVQISTVYCTDIQ